MAWLDDRFWCHPKITSLSDRAYRSHVNAITYCAGFGTGGVLTSAQQKAIGVTPKAKLELVSSQLWDENFPGKTAADNGSVRIHDWDDHNGKRDERRAADKERKRTARAKEREQRPQDRTRTKLRTAEAASAGQGPDKTSDRRTLKVVKEVTDEGQPTTDVAESPTERSRTKAVLEASYEGPDDSTAEADDGTALDFQLSNYNDLLKEMPS